MRWSRSKASTLRLEAEAAQSSRRAESARSPSTVDIPEVPRACLRLASPWGAPRRVAGPMPDHQVGTPRPIWARSVAPPRWALSSVFHTAFSHCATEKESGNRAPRRGPWWSNARHPLTLSPRQAHRPRYEAEAIPRPYSGNGATAPFVAGRRPCARMPRGVLAEGRYPLPAGANPSLFGPLPPTGEMLVTRLA